jgi:RNA polymerase sigma-70 factor (ECF subfamily)
MPDRDAELMQQVARGDHAAFNDLVQKYRPMVLNTAFRYVGDHEEAEDLAQEAFLRVYEARYRYRPTARFSTYLYRVVANVCLDAQRRRQARPVESLEALEEGGPLEDKRSPSPHEAVERRELQATVRAAIASLPSRQRLAVILHRYEGLSYREIAEALDCSVSAVETLLHRAKQSLKEYLRDYVEESAEAPQVFRGGCVKKGRAVGSTRP